MEKKEIKESLYIYIENLLNGELNEICAKIQDIPNRLRKENERVKQNPDIWLRFELKQEYYGYDGGSELNIYGVRLETDEEFEKRKLQLKKQAEKRVKEKAKKEEREKAQFEKLKAKYGN